MNANTDRANLVMVKPRQIRQIPNKLKSKSTAQAMVAFVSVVSLVVMVGITVGCKTSAPRAAFPSLTKAPIDVPIQWHSDFDKAVEIANQTNRPLLVNFTGSDWCSWCVKLKSDVFSTDEFNQWAKDQVVLVELDYPKNKPQLPATKRRNQDLAEKYLVQNYPTVLLISPQGEVLGPKLGYKDSPTNWIAAAQPILTTGGR